MPKINRGALDIVTMGTVISFEERAVATLRDRLGAAEEANQDLIAFARGHSGATHAIQGAVLALLEADSLDAVFDTVARDWPTILGIDAVALALVADGRGFRADRNGVERVEPKLIERAIEGVDGVVLRSVGRGHPLFGPAAEAIRSEALIAFDGDGPLPRGLIILGQHHALPIDGGHGAQLLMFLGTTLAAIIRRWLIDR